MLKTSKTPLSLDWDFKEMNLKSSSQPNDFLLWRLGTPVTSSPAAWRRRRHRWKPQKIPFPFSVSSQQSRHSCIYRTSCCQQLPLSPSEEHRSPQSRRACGRRLQPILLHCISLTGSNLRLRERWTEPHSWGGSVEQLGSSLNLQLQPEDSSSGFRCSERGEITLIWSQNQSEKNPLGCFQTGFSLKLHTFRVHVLVHVQPQKDMMLLRLSLTGPSEAPRRLRAWSAHPDSDFLQSNLHPECCKLRLLSLCYSTIVAFWFEEKCK